VRVFDGESGACLVTLPDRFTAREGMGLLVLATSEGLPRLAVRRASALSVYDPATRGIRTSTVSLSTPPPPTLGPTPPVLAAFANVDGKGGACLVSERTTYRAVRHVTRPRVAVVHVRCR
jgi:hypothetical protein